MDKIIELMNVDKDLPLVMINKSGEITYVNSQFEVLFDWTHDEILHKSILTIIPQNMHHAHNIGFSRFINTNKSTLLDQKLSLRAVKKNGQEFNAYHYITSISYQDEMLFAANITEIIE